MDLSRLPPFVAFGALAAALAVAALRQEPAVCAAGADAAAASSPPAWAETVERGDDHVDARALLALLDADPGRVLLVDVRPAEEFAAFRLRGAQNLSVPGLLGAEGTALLDAHARRRPDGLVVLVSNGMTHPGQAWVELARRGRTNCRILEDGIEGLRADLLLPPSLRGPTTEAAAKAAGAEHARARRLLLPDAPVGSPADDGRTHRRSR